MNAKPGLPPQTLGKPGSLLWGLMAGFPLILSPAVSLQGADTAPTNQAAPFAVSVTGAGRPMLLIPGLGCGGNVWDGTVAHFKSSYQCHVVTLAGFAGQPVIGSPVLSRVVDGLSRYIGDHRLERPVIIGHSLGGFLAFWLAAEHPDQVGPLIAVDGVPFFPALKDTNATPQSAQPFAENLRNVYKAQSPAAFAMGYRMFLQGMITDPSEVQRVAKLSDKSDPEAVGQAFYETLTTDLRPKLKAIRVPVLLLGATASIADPALKKTTEENYRLEVAAIPNHKVVFAPKARHFIQLDEPEFFYRQVESFLKDSAQ